MNYKSQSPVLDIDLKANIEKLLGYVEDIKSETEARITLIEKIIEQLKNVKSSQEEVKI